MEKFFGKQIWKKRKCRIRCVIIVDGYGNFLKSKYPLNIRKYEIFSIPRHGNFFEIFHLWKTIWKCRGLIL